MNVQQISIEALSKCKHQFLQQLRWYTFINCGYDMLMITYDDKVYGFGNNHHYNGTLNLGHKHQSDNLEPIELCELRGKSVIDIAHDVKHVLALTKTGEIYSVGKNEYNHLYLINRLVPGYIVRKIPFDQIVTSIKCGSFYNLVLTDSKKVYTWESKWKDDGTTNEDEEVPVQVKGLESHSIVAIESGFFHSAALSDKGEVFTWGCNNPDMEEGTIDCQTKLTKVDIPDVFFVTIACGRIHTLLLSNEGQIYSIKDNAFYPEFDPLSLRNQSLKPVLVSNEIRFKSIAAYCELSIAISELGYCYVWGEVKGCESTDVPLKTNLLSISDAFVRYLTPQEIPCLIEYTLQQASNPVTDRLSALFNKQEGSDVTFCVDEQKIFAHRGFLQTVSPYFNRMFSENWLQSETITITEYDYSVFFAYLQFLYTGRFELELDEVAQLLTLAHYYLDDQLKDRCLEILEESIDIYNCCLLYQLAVRYRMDQFEMIVRRFINNNLPVVLHSKSYSQLDVESQEKFTLMFGSIQQLESK